MLEWPIGHVEQNYKMFNKSIYHHIERVPGGWIYWTQEASASSTDGLFLCLTSGVFVPEPANAGFERIDLKEKGLVDEQTGATQHHCFRCRNCNTDFGTIPKKGDQ